MVKDGELVRRPGGVYEIRRYSCQPAETSARKDEKEILRKDPRPKDAENWSARWSVNTPEFLTEVFENLSPSKTHGVLQKPMQIFMRMLGGMVDYAVELDDPRLNTHLIRLTLLESAHPSHEDYRPTRTYMSEVERGILPDKHIHEKPDEDGHWWRKHKQTGRVECCDVLLTGSKKVPKAVTVVNGSLWPADRVKEYEWVVARSPWDGLPEAK